MFGLMRFLGFVLTPLVAAMAAVSTVWIGARFSGLVSSPTIAAVVTIALAFVSGVTSWWWWVRRVRNLRPVTLPALPAVESMEEALADFAEAGD